MLIDRATHVENIECACKSILCPPEKQQIGEETIYLFGGNVELRIAHKRRRFALRDYGILRCPVGISDSLPKDCWDATKEPIWNLQFYRDWWLPDAHGEADLDVGDIDAFAGPCKQLRYAQVRAIRRVLLSELPREIASWVARMRFPWLTFADVGVLWRHFEEVSITAAENIGLLPVCLLFAFDMAAPIERYERWSLGAIDLHVSRWLRTHPAELNVPPHVWRLLCEHGVNLLPSISEVLVPDDPNERYSQVLSYLRLLATATGPVPMSQAEKSVIWRLAESCRQNKKGDLLEEASPR